MPIISAPLHPQSKGAKVILVWLMAGIEKPFLLKLSLQCQKHKGYVLLHSFPKEVSAMIVLYLEENNKNIIMLWRVTCDPASLKGIFLG